MKLIVISWPQWTLSWLSSEEPEEQLSHGLSNPPWVAVNDGVPSLQRQWGVRTMWLTRWDRSPPLITTLLVEFTLKDMGWMKGHWFQRLWCQQAQPRACEHVFLIDSQGLLVQHVTHSYSVMAAQRITSWLWYCTPIISALGREEFRVILSYIVSLRIDSPEQ